MQLVDVLAADRIAVDISVTSKKTLLEKLSALLATAPGSAPSRTIFDSLCQRERLGSTGLGHGVAIPHGRVDSQQEVAGAMVRLRQPIDFNAPDSHKVDLFSRWPFHNAAPMSICAFWRKWPSCWASKSSAQCCARPVTPTICCVC